MIALFALPTDAAAPEPVTVFLVAPAGDAWNPKPFSFLPICSIGLLRPKNENCRCRAR